MHLAQDGAGRITLLGEAGHGMGQIGSGWDTALDLFGKLATAGAGFAQGEAAKKQLAAQGEAAFSVMKAAAEAAKWPADLSPRVVTLDKAWQTMKQGPLDATSVGAIVEQMHAVTDQLTGGAPHPSAGTGGGAAGGGGGHAGKAPSSSLAKVVYALGALAVVGVGWRLLRPAPTPAPALKGAYRRRRLPAYAAGW